LFDLVFVLNTHFNVDFGMINWLLLQKRSFSEARVFVVDLGEFF